MYSQYHVLLFLVFSGPPADVYVPNIIFEIQDSPPKLMHFQRKTELRACEEDTEIEGLFEEFSTGEVIPVKILQNVAQNCSPSIPTEWLGALATPRSDDEDYIFTKSDLREVLLGNVDARRQSNARWISQQKNKKIVKDPEVTFPGTNEEDRNKNGQKTYKHLRIDELNLGELDDDAEFERLKLTLKSGNTGNVKLSRATDSDEDDPTKVNSEVRSESTKERSVLHRNSILPILTESEHNLNMLHSKLNAIQMSKRPPSPQSPRKIRTVNAAILSELFTKHHPKTHTVDDVLTAINREEGFSHGWEDQRRKPGTTVMFVGQARLARKAQHGFMLPEVNFSPKPVSTYLHPSNQNPTEPKHNRTSSVANQLPEWKQAWKMLSTTQKKTGLSKRFNLSETRKYKGVQGSGLHGLSEEKPYHLSPLQRAECLERAHTSMECDVRNNIQLQRVASKALTALTAWKSDPYSPTDATAYARTHYASLRPQNK